MRLQLKTSKSRFAKLGVIVVCFSMISCSSPEEILANRMQRGIDAVHSNWKKNAQLSGVQIKNTAISPDGTVVAFQYDVLDTVNEAKFGGVGLYNVHSKTIESVPNPEGKQYAHPDFSQNGRRLLLLETLQGNGLTGSYIAELDITSKRVLNRWKCSTLCRYPLYRPDSLDILYQSSSGLSQRFIKLNTKTGNETRYLEGEDAFRFTRQPSFVDSNTIIFQGYGGIGQKWREINAVLRERDFRAVTEYAWIMRLGEVPELFRLTKSGNHKGNAQHKANVVYQALSSPSTSNELIFARRIWDDGVEASAYQLFALHQGSLRQLTNYQYRSEDGRPKLINTIRDTSVSSHGVIAYVMTPNVERPIDRAFDLYIYDSRTGLSEKTGVVEFLRKDLKDVNIIKR